MPCCGFTPGSYGEFLGSFVIDACGLFVAYVEDSALYQVRTNQVLPLT